MADIDVMIADDQPLSLSECAVRSPIRVICEFSLNATINSFWSTPCVSPSRCAAGERGDSER